MKARNKKTTPTDTAAEPVWNLDILPEHPEPDQPEDAEYLQISFEGETIEPKQYERLLLQAYNHPEINWQEVQEKRNIAEEILSPDEWQLYRQADKTFKVWDRVAPYICSQFRYLNTYTNLIRKINCSNEKSKADFSCIIDKETQEEFRETISRVFALHIMEQRLFVSNDIATYLRPSKLTHHLTFIIASAIEYSKIANIDFKPNLQSIKEMTDLIGFDKYEYNEIKKTVLFYSDQIEL